MDVARKVVVDRSNDAVHMHVDGPTLAQDKSYQSIIDLMGWGNKSIPNLPMSMVNPPSTVLAPSLFPQSYVPPLDWPRTSLLGAASIPGLSVRTNPTPATTDLRPSKRRRRERAMSHLSDYYPSSSSSTDMPSPRKVLAMLPETAKEPNRFMGKQRTKSPTYTNSIWPREKACCVHACGDSSEELPSSTVYSVTQVLAVRSFWYELSTSDRRQFIANRMEEVDTGGEAPTRRYYLDTPDVINHGLALDCNRKVSSLCVCVCGGMCVYVCVCVYASVCVGVCVFISV